MYDNLSNIVVACDCALDFEVGLNGHHGYWLVRRHENPHHPTKEVPP